MAPFGDHTLMCTGPDRKIGVGRGVGNCAQDQGGDQGSGCFRHENTYATSCSALAETVTDGRAAASCRIMSAPFSPIITMAALVLPETTDGMMEPSTTRSAPMPRMRRRSST